MYKLKVFFILIAGLFLFACATSEDMRALNAKISELSDTLTTVQANQADLSLKMDDLSRDITISNENIKELDNQMTRLSSRIDDMSTVLAAKAEAEAEASKKKVLLPSQLFEEAEANITKGNLGIAEEGFQLYLKNYPQGEYAEKSQYLLGDIYFAQKKYQDAAVAYATTMKNFPKSKSMPSYRLKYANSILPLKKNAEAKKYFQSIVQDYPKSPEAKLAAAAAAKIK